MTMTRTDFVLATLGLTVPEIVGFHGMGIVDDEEPRHIWIMTWARTRVTPTGEQGETVDMSGLAWHIEREAQYKIDGAVYAVEVFHWPPPFESLLSEIAAFDRHWEGDWKEAGEFERELARRYGYEATLAKGRKLAAEYGAKQ